MYKYLEHRADIGIYASGDSWKEVFIEAAKATVAIEFKRKKNKLPEKQKKVEISVSAKDIENLLVEFLNEIVSIKDIENIVPIEFKIFYLTKENSDFSLKAEIDGISFDEKFFKLGQEVKGATYSGLKCGEKDGSFFCQCILDI